MANDLITMRCTKCGTVMPIVKFWGDKEVSIHQKENFESFLGQHSLFCGTDSFEVLNEDDFVERDIEYHKNRYNPEKWLQQIDEGSDD